MEREAATARRFAYHDELTGLPNRRLLLDRFNQAVARGNRQHQQVAQLEVPYAVGYSTITNTASIGMAIFPIDGCDLCDLIKASDRDMYRNRARGLALLSVPERGSWSWPSARAAGPVAAGQS